MFDASRRPIGRLSYWVMAAVMMCGLVRTASGAGAVPPSGPATTTVADTVYLADGNPAQGNLIITWPPFLTASGTAIAGGTKNVALGTSGALSVALVPNAEANPAGVYYTVVYQLGPGQTRTEYWIVPTTSPANLAAVRTTPGSGMAGQPVSMQYVNSELATKANDSAVVHLGGNGNHQRSKNIRRRTQRSGADEHGTGCEQGICGLVDFQCRRGKLLVDRGRDDDRAYPFAGKSSFGSPGIDQAIR